MSNRRKNTYPLQPWEGTGSKSDTYTRFTMSMMTSPAWIDLSPQQKTLYIACKMQMFAEKKKPNDDPAQFTMNRSKWADLYQLYTKGSNERGFYRDMQALIDHGFIECVMSGKPNRTKNIYRYSAMWQKWGTPGFEISPAAYPMTKTRPAPPSCSQDTGPAADQQGEPQREEITQADQNTTAAALEDSTGPADQTQDEPSEAEQNAAKLKAQAIAAMRASM